MATGVDILSAVRTMGVEEMWETNPDPRLSGTKSLEQILSAQREVPYPEGSYSGYCDLVVPGNPGNKWVECKFSWTYDADRKPAQRNRNYKKHLLTGKEGSAMKDVTAKLPSLLGQSGVDWIGFLMVFFHSVQLPIPDGDVEELEVEGGLNSPP